MTSVSTQEIHTSLLKSFHEKSVHRPNQSEGQSGDKRSFVLVETRSESMQVVLKRRVHNQEAETLQSVCKSSNFVRTECPGNEETNGND